MHNPTTTTHGTAGTDRATTTTTAASGPEPPVGDKPPEGSAQAPPAPDGLYAHPEAKPPNPFGTTVWLGCSLIVLIHGGIHLLGGELLALIEVIASVGSLWYLGAVHRFVQAITRSSKRGADSSSEVMKLDVSERPLEVAVPAPISATVDYIAVEILDGRPVVVVPTPLEPANPKRWLSVKRRADAFERVHVLPALPFHHGWWFGTAGFYLRRDDQGFYAIPGHPDDKVVARSVQRLVDETPIQVGDYTLTVTGIDFAN